MNNYLPSELPLVDVVIIGHVDHLPSTSVDWQYIDNFKYAGEFVGGHSVLYLEDEYGHWENHMYDVVKEVIQKTTAKTLIYTDGTGSLDPFYKVNKTIASGSRAILGDKIVTWSNIFNDNHSIITYGSIISLPSEINLAWDLVRSGTNEDFSDFETAWAALACEELGVQFSYIHLVVDNLTNSDVKDIDELSDDERSQILETRNNYFLVIKEIILETLDSRLSKIGSKIRFAQQARVDCGIINPLKRDWKACLSYARHTEEEAFEVIRELPRKEWKNQQVFPEKVLEEMADVQIQLLTALAYAGFNQQDLINAVEKKLQVKRPDWK